MNLKEQKGVDEMVGERKYKGKQCNCGIILQIKDVVKDIAET